MIAINKRNIKEEFAEAEKTFEFCWNVLIVLKDLSLARKDFELDLLTFQDKLATTIFKLQSIRETIILQEKNYIKNKANYDLKWFGTKMKILATYKKGVDNVVNIAKAFGDAYAYFFYQKDLELFTEHLSHQKISNKNAGIGERGELEFIKSVKHIQGNFTLFHGITNVLRYGDYSFIDLKTLTVVGIGELKTKHIEPTKLELNLFYIKRIKTLEKSKSSKKETDKRKRQLINIDNFLHPEKKSTDKSAKLYSDSYSFEVENLIKASRLKKSSFIKVSNGLAFGCIKLKKTSLYNRIFHTKFNSVENFGSDATSILNQLINKDSPNNGIVLGQLLYNPDFTDKNTPGTVPIFWHKINHRILKKIYFADCVVISMFNPTYLIEEVEELGFDVDSKYSKKKVAFDSISKNAVQHFDLFLSYIMNFLMSEDFVIKSINEIKNHNYQSSTIVQMKPQQKL